MTISIFQDGGHRVGNLLPVSVLVTVLVREDGNLLAYQISMRYLNPRLRQNYFRFRNTDGRHLEKLILRHNFAADSPIMTKFDSLMQNDEPMTINRLNRNQKHNYNMAAVPFPKPELVLS